MAQPWENFNRACKHSLGPQDCSGSIRALPVVRTARTKAVSMIPNPKISYIRSARDATGRTAMRSRPSA